LVKKTEGILGVKVPHAFLSCSPYPFLGIIVDSKETRNTIAFDTSIFGAKTRDKKEKRNSIYI
jgi:hypothetical protein